MRSLTIENGDLVLGSGGYTTVEGSQRIIQDLGLAIREPYGMDRFHPRWGTLLDSYVGMVIGPDTPVLIEAEARRMVGNYVALQQQQLQREATAGRPSRFISGEVIIGVAGVALSQNYDRLAVKITLDTLGQTPIEVQTQVVT
jgi:hypothetical protein